MTGSFRILPCLTSLVSPVFPTFLEVLAFLRQRTKGVLPDPSSVSLKFIKENLKAGRDAAVEEVKAECFAKHGAQ